MSKKVIDLIFKIPKTLLVLSLLLSVFLGLGLKDFKEKHDVRIWFSEDNPHLKVLNQLEAQFGNDETVVIAIHNKDGILNPKSIKLIQDLTERMWRVNQILRVDSFSNFNITEVDEDDINIRPFMEDDIESLTGEKVEQLKKEALAHRVIPNYLVSKDLTTAMIYARIIPSIVSVPNYEKLIDETRAVLKEFDDGDHDFYVSGQAVITNTFKEIAASDMRTIMPVLFLSIILILIFIFRDFKSVIYPLVVTVVSLVATMGFIFHAGIVFNSVLGIIPAVITAIAIADSVHIVSSYRQALKSMGNVDAVRYALNKNFIPTLLTSLSTAVGFLSLSSASLKPISEMGIIAGFGCFYAWLISYFLLGPIFVLFPIKLKGKEAIRKEGHEEKKIGKVAMFFSRFIDRYKVLVTLVFVILTTLAFVATTKVTINANPYDYFKSDTEMAIANNFLKSKIGGTSGPELIIFADKSDGVKDPKFLKKVEKLKSWLNSFESVTKTIDLIDIIKEMNWALSGGKESGYSLADSQNSIAEQLFLYQMSLPQGMDITNKVSLNYDSMRMSVLWSIDDTQESLRMVKLIEEKTKELGLRVKITGKLLLLQRMSGYIISTLLSSILIAFGIVSLMLMITFRSISIGLLSIIPNLVPLVLGGLFMYIFNINLNFGTALVFSVCLGIAVDDTIHFLSNYYNLTQVQKMSKHEAIKHILQFTGSALVFTTVILVLGFGLFMLGDFVPNIHFGALCALILTSALIVDMILLPSILLFGEEKKS